MNVVIAIFLLKPSVYCNMIRDIVVIGMAMDAMHRKYFPYGYFDAPVNFSAARPITPKIYGMETRMKLVGRLTKIKTKTQIFSNKVYQNANFTVH